MLYLFGITIHNSFKYLLTRLVDKVVINPLNNINYIDPTQGKALTTRK